MVREYDPEAFPEVKQVSLHFPQPLPYRHLPQGHPASDPRAPALRGGAPSLATHLLPPTRSPVCLNAQGRAAQPPFRC